MNVFVIFIVIMTFIAVVGCFYLYLLYRRWTSNTGWFSCSSKEEGYITDVDYGKDMLNYRWFSSDSHTYMKLSFDSLKGDQCLVVKFRNVGCNYVCLDAYNPSTTSLVSLSNGILIDRDNEEKTVVVSRSINSNYMLRRNRPELAEAARMLVSSENDNINFIIDVDTGENGSFEVLTVERHTLSTDVRRTQMFDFDPLFVRNDISENMWLTRNNMIDKIGMDLAVNNREIINVNNCGYVNKDEMCKWITSEYNNLSVGVGTNDFINRNTMVFSAEINNNTTIYFVDHKELSKSIYNRISLVDKYGSEIKGFEPNESNKIDDYIHKVVIDTDDLRGDSCRLFEIIKDSPSPSHNTIYRMSVLETMSYKEI